MSKPFEEKGVKRLEGRIDDNTKAKVILAWLGPHRSIPGFKQKAQESNICLLPAQSADATHKLVAGGRNSKIMAIFVDCREQQKLNKKQELAEIIKEHRENSDLIAIIEDNQSPDKYFNAGFLLVTTWGKACHCLGHIINVSRGKPT